MLHQFEVLQVEIEKAGAARELLEEELEGTGRTPPTSQPGKPCCLQTQAVCSITSDHRIMENGQLSLLHSNDESLFCCRRLPEVVKMTFLPVSSHIFLIH